MAKKSFYWEGNWAEAIYRKRHEGKEYLFAYVRRKHSYDDVDMNGEGKWIGMVAKPVHKMSLDKDEDSDTYGQRVPEVNTVEYQDGSKKHIPIVTGTKYEYVYEVNKKNVENFQKLYGSTIQGTTQLIWILTSKNYTCEYPEDFWTSSLRDVEDAIRKRKSIRNELTNTD